MLIFGHNDCGAYPGAPPEAVAADVRRAAEIVSSAEASLGMPGVPLKVVAPL